MPRRDEARLGRLLRVRALQLDQARVEEMAAAERNSSAHALVTRIASLSRDVAPRAGTDQGLALFAAAHYRQRLARSHEEAQRRVDATRQQLDSAREATGVAKRDHGAIEKLIARELDAQAVDARRALENAPHPAQALARSLLRSG
jgi:flagellar FliJ protein